MWDYIYNYFKKPKKSSETVVLVSPDKNASATQNTTRTSVPFPSNSWHYYIFDNEKSWDKFCSTHFYTPRIDVGRVYDMNYYRGEVIRGKIAEEVEKEISKSLEKAGSGNLKFLCLEINGDEDKVAFPAVRVEQLKSGKEINLKDLLDNDTCKKRNVHSITLCGSDDNKTRGIRLSICQDEVRMYEVANGSYEMTLTWYVKEKECKIKVLIHSDKPVELLERNGVTEEQIRANTSVMLGPQCKTKLLYEALAPQLQQKNSEQKSSEEVKVLSEAASKAKDFVKKSPEAKSALKELGSQLQQKETREQSSVEQKVKFPEEELKGVTNSRLLPNMPDPTKWDISELVEQLGGPSTDLREVKNALLLKKGSISERELNQLG